MTQRTMLSKHYQVSMAGLRILALCKNKRRALDFAAKNHRASLWNLKSYICNKPLDFVICICIKTSHLDKDPRTLARLPHASEKNLTNLLGFISFSFSKSMFVAINFVLYLFMSMHHKCFYLLD